MGKLHKINGKFDPENSLRDLVFALQNPQYYTDKTILVTPEELETYLAGADNSLHIERRALTAHFFEQIATQIFKTLDNAKTKIFSADTRPISVKENVKQLLVATNLLSQGLYFNQQGAEGIKLKSKYSQTAKVTNLIEYEPKKPLSLSRLKNSMRVLIKAICQKWESEAVQENHFRRFFQLVLILPASRYTPAEELESGLNTAVNTILDLIGIIPKVFEANHSRIITETEFREIIYSQAFKRLILQLTLVNILSFTAINKIIENPEHLDSDQKYSPEHFELDGQELKFKQSTLEETIAATKVKLTNLDLESLKGKKDKSGHYYTQRTKCPAHYKSAALLGIVNRVIDLAARHYLPRFRQPEPNNHQSSQQAL